MKPDLFSSLLAVNPDLKVEPLFKTPKAHAAWTKRFRDKMRPILEQHSRAHEPSDLIFGPIKHLKDP